MSTFNTNFDSQNMTPIMVPVGTTLQSIIDAEQASANLVSIVDGQVSPSFNAVTASTFYATQNGAGNSFRMGDDATIGDVNLSNTVGIIGIQDPKAGYVKFGQSGPVFGYTNSGALPAAGTATTGSLLISGSNLYFYNGQAGNGGWATVK
jgi:hypothetical protein